MKLFVVLIFVCNFSHIFCNIPEAIWSDEEVRNNDIISIRTEDENQRPELENSNRLEEDDDHADNDEYNMQADEPLPASDSDKEAAFDTNGETNSEIPSTTEDIPSSSQYDYNDGELITPNTTESFLEEITADVASNNAKLDVSENMLEQDILSKTTTEITTEENSSVTVPSESINQVEDGDPSGKYRQVNVNKLSDQIRIVLKNYKDSGNVIVPNITIPDPMSIPDTYRRISMVSMNLQNQMVYGLSNFTVQHINTDLEKKQVFVMLHMKRLVILGNYKMSSLFSKASGPFNVTLLDVITEGAAALNYTADGSLEATQTDMDMSFRDVKLDFKNLGIMGSFFQGVLGAVGNLVFEGIKPVILTEVNTNMKDDINVKIRSMTSGMQSNTSVSPIDQAVLEGRRYVKRQGYDPYELANFTARVGLFNVNISKFQIEGLSKFYRVGDVGLSMDNGTVEFGVHVATDKLTGNCSWSVFLGKKLFRNGTANFTIDHIQGRGNIRQSLDLKNRLNLHDLDFFVGDINLTTERKDAIDLFIEQVANKLPKIIKHAIVDGIEEPVKFTVQKILDLVDVEKIVDQQLPILDKLGYR